MSYNGGIKYTEPLDFLPKSFDGREVISDRKSGWMVTTRTLGRWVSIGPDRSAADRIVEALHDVERKTEERIAEALRNPPEPNEPSVEN